jgi:hypothetical protein
MREGGPQAESQRTPAVGGYALGLFRGPTRPYTLGRFCVYTTLAPGVDQPQLGANVAADLLRAAEQKAKLLTKEQSQ